MSRAGFVLRPANPENLERPPPGSAADLLRVARLAARMLDTLEVTVVRCADLPNVALFGSMSARVAVEINAHKQYTPSHSMVAETSCEFNDKLVFHLDCQPTDVVHLAVKHIGVLRSTVVGVALMSVADFVAQAGKIMRIQLVHPDDLNKHTGTIEIKCDLVAPQPSPN